MKYITPKKIVQGGYMLLLTVLIVSSVVLTVSISIVLLGVDQSVMFFTQEKSQRATGLAHACIESALERIKDTNSYTGSTTISSFDEGECEYNVSNTGGVTRLINGKGIDDDVVRKVQVNINNVDPITVNSWLEVADF